MASSCVPLATAVPPSAPLYVDEPLQYIGPSPATTSPAPAALPDSAAAAVRPLLSPASGSAAVTCTTSPCTEINSTYLGPAIAPTATALSPAHLDSDLLLATAMATASSTQRAPCLNYFLTGKQRPAMSPPPATKNHPASPLLKKYAERGCPAAVGMAWPLDIINSAIDTFPHASTLTPEATDFCQQELLEQAQRGFSIVLPVDVALLVFGDYIRISPLASV